MLVFSPNAPIQWSWLTLFGPDARDFLHRLTTANVRELELGHGAPGCLLTAQGKLRAWFTLWNYGPDDFAFELDAGASGAWKARLLETIDQFHFGEKITIADVGVLECRWLFPESASELAQATGAVLAPHATLALDEEIRVCHHGEADFGRPWVTVWGRPARLAQWLDRVNPAARAVAHEQLEEWRIAALRPRVGAEIEGELVPLEAGLVETISANKGCYPGQEVIEKIVSLGSPARRLVRLEGTGDRPASGAPIQTAATPPGELGAVTSSFAREGGYVALGFVRKLGATPGLEVRVGGAPAKIVAVSPYKTHE
jgi:folate-binding protein YgfZ